VFDQNNAAVAGAVVTLTKTDGTVRQTITTGSGGAFSFENPPAGSYRLLVSRQGFAVQEQVLDLPLSGAGLDIVLKPDATRLTVTVTAEGDSFAAVKPSPRAPCHGGLEDQPSDADFRKGLRIPKPEEFGNCSGACLLPEARRQGRNPDGASAVMIVRLAAREAAARAEAAGLR
jgi:hypothetical protein